MPLTFVKPRLMRWNNNAITDHNRQPLTISVERIEKATRMANGTMRKYVVGDKRTFTTSWQNVPKLDANTVDGFYGGGSMETFYNNNKGSFPLEITEADGTVTTYTVMFTDFSKDIVFRGTSGKDLWNVNVTMVEV